METRWRRDGERHPHRLLSARQQQTLTLPIGVVSAGHTDRNVWQSPGIAGVTFGAADVEFADLGTTNSGVTTICRGTSC